MIKLSSVLLVLNLDTSLLIDLSLPPLAGGPADYGPVLLTENLHLIVFPPADLLQELLGDSDAEAAVGPLDHVEVGHEWGLFICTVAEQWRAAPCTVGYRKHPSRYIWFPFLLHPEPPDTLCSQSALNGKSIFVYFLYTKC